MLVVAALALTVSAEPRHSARVWQTQSSGGGLHETHPIVASSCEAYEAATVDLDAARPSHPYLGIGGGFAEASCKLIMSLPEGRRAELLRMLFAKDGANLNIGRLHVGASDYSTKVYTLDDGVADPELKRFSIDPDREWILPAVKAALQVRPDLFLFSSPWSPPAWMKTNGSLYGGWMRTKWLPVFADYYVAWLKAYCAEGIPVAALTIQNEPECERSGSPTCLWHPDQEAEVAGRLLPPRLRAAGLSTKIWIWDHNFDRWQRPLNQLKDPDVRTNVDAVAFHPYCGRPEALDRFRAACPGVTVHQTEIGPSASWGTGGSSLACWGERVLKCLNHGCSSFVNWCLVLDEKGYPNTSVGLDCYGLVSVETKSGAIIPSAQYEVFCHIGRFVDRGSTVLDSFVERPVFENGGDHLIATAFRNADGSHAVVVLCDQPENGHSQFQVKYRGEWYQVSLPGTSVSTILFR